MSKRRRPCTPSLSKQIAILFARFVIHCGLCGERIEKPEDAEWDHIHEHADGGADTIDNMRPVHGRRTDDTLKCHQRKSGKATTQRARIARIEEKRLAVPSQLPAGADLQKCHRGCGEYLSDCRCPPKPERKSQFGNRPMRARQAVAR